jgi:carboxypeptidase C (cathepsin A)
VVSAVGCVDVWALVASSGAVEGPADAAVNDHINRELAVAIDLPYRATAKLWKEWDWRPVPEDQPWEPSWVNVARRLSGTMRRNPALRVMVASGYYDFATPFFDAELTLRRHAFLEDRINFTYYEAGYLMYVHEPSLESFMTDVRGFIGVSSP